jgi:hypothetical protein
MSDRAAAQFSAKLNSGHAGQHPVQEKEIGWGTGGFGEGFGAVTCIFNSEPLFFKIIPQKRHELRIIFNNEDRGLAMVFHCHPTGYALPVTRSIPFARLGRQRNAMSRKTELGKIEGTREPRGHQGSIAPNAKISGRQRVSAGFSLQSHPILVKGPALKIRSDARFQGLGGSWAYAQQKQMRWMAPAHGI